MVSLGSASFEFVADSAQLAQAFAEAEVAARRSSSAIQASVKAVQDATKAGFSPDAIKQVTAAYTEQAAKAVQASAQASAAFRSQLQAAQQAAQGTQQAGKAIQQAGQASTQAASGFSASAKELLAVGAAVTGVTVGLESIKKGMDAAVEATLKQEQAARTLSATYGDAAGQMKAFADGQAAAFNRTNTEVENGVARMQLLQRQYGLTSDEIQKLTKLALNLGATFGDQEEAIRSVQAAVRGEPEALEKYGIALQQNAIQGNHLLTEEQKKNFASLDAVTQARLRYQIILEQGAGFEDGAIKRAQSAQGAFDALTRSENELAKAVGSSLTPAMAQAASGLSGLIDRITEAIKKNKEFQDQYGYHGLQLGINPPEQAMQQPDTRDTGTTFGPPVGDVKAINQQIEAEEREHQRVVTQIQQDAVKARIKAVEDEVAAKKDAYEKDYENRKTTLEAAEAAELDGIKKGEQDALDLIKGRADKERAAIEAQIRDYEVERDAKKKNVEDQRDNALAAIDAEKQAVHDAADAKIRDYEIEKDHKIKAADEARDAAIRDLDAEKQAAAARRTQQDRDLQDYTTTAKRAEDDRHTAVERGLEDEVQAIGRKKDAAVRALDDEAKAAQATAQKRVAAIEAEEKKAQEAHDKKVAQIQAEEQAAQKQHDQKVRELDDEQKAAQKQHDATMAALDEEEKAHLAILDAQLKALDTAEKQQQAAEKLASLQKRVADAQQALTDAQPKGTPEQIQGAANQAALAIRLGDPQTIAATQKAYEDLAGKGVEAVAKAQQDLADAQASLNDETTKESNDAERDRLQTAEQAIKDETDARKQAADTTLQQIKDQVDASKQAADDELAATKDKLDKEKQAADASLAQTKSRLDSQKAAVQAEAQSEQDSIAKRKQAVEDQAKGEIEQVNARKQAEQDLHDQNDRNIQDETQARQRALQDQRTAEDAQFAARQTQIEAEHQSAIDSIRDQYDSEEHGVIPATRRATAAYNEEAAAKEAGIKATSAASLQAIDDEYNNVKTGKIPNAQRAAQEVDRQAQAEAQSVSRAAAQMTKDVQAHYHNPDRTGSIDLIEDEKKAFEENLKAEIEDVQNWAKLLAPEVQKVTDAFDALTQAITKSNQAVQQAPTAPGGSPAASSRSGSGGGSASSGSNGGGQLSTNPVRSATTGQVTHASPYLDIINKVANETGEDPALIAAIIDTENSAPDAISKDNARGIGQVIPGQGYDLPGEDARDPETSIRQTVRAIQDKRKILQSQGIEATPSNIAGRYFGQGSDGNISQGEYERRFRQHYQDYPVQPAQPPMAPSQAAAASPTPTNPLSTVPGGSPDIDSLGPDVRVFTDPDGTIYYVTPDGKTYLQGADGHLSMVGVNKSDYDRGRPLQRQQPVTKPQAGTSGDAGTFIPERNIETLPAFDKSKINTSLNQFQASTLTSEEAKAACGPAAAVWFAQAVGRNPTLEEATRLAKAFGWTPQAGTPVAAETPLINELIAGSGAHAIQMAPTAANVNQALSEGSPVGFDILPGGGFPGHFAVATGGTAEGGLDLGATGQAIGINGPITLQQLQALGGGLAPIIRLVKDASAAVTEFGDDTTVMAKTSSDSFGTVTTEVTDSAGNVIKTVTDEGGQVISQTATMSDGTVKNFTDMNTGATAQVTTMSDGLTETISTLGDTSIATFTDLSGQVVGQATTMSDGTIAATGAMADGVTSSVTDMDGTVTDTFTDLLGNVTTTTTDMQGNVTKTFTDLAGNTTTIVTDMSGKITTTVTDATGKVVKQFETIPPATKAAADSFKPVADAITNMPQLDMRDTVAQLDTVGQHAKKATQSLDDFIKAQEDAGASDSGKQSKKSHSKDDSGEGGGFGGKASGGPVYAGQTYMVGEHGPELFTPEQNGFIVPHDKLAGGSFVDPSSWLGAVPSPYLMAGSPRGGGIGSADAGGIIAKLTDIEQAVRTIRQPQVTVNTQARESSLLHDVTIMKAQAQGRG